MADNQTELLRLRAKAKAKAERERGSQAPTAEVPAPIAGGPPLSEMQFTPDSAPQETPVMDVVRAQANNAVDLLPAAGAAVGGIVGGAAGLPALGVGAAGGGLVGAGLGGAAGKSLKDTINYFRGSPDVPSTPTAQLESAGTGAVEGLAQEMAAPLVLKPITYVGQAAGKGVGAVGSAMSAWANDISAATAGRTTNEILTFGLDKTRRLGEYLMKIGQTGRPRFLTTVNSNVEKLRSETGSELDRLYHRLSSEPGTEITKGNLTAALQERAAQEYAERQLPLPQGVAEDVAAYVEKSLPELPANTTLTPKQTWELAKTWEEAAGTWRRSLQGDSTGKAQVLDAMATGVRKINDGLAASSAWPDVADLPLVSEHYSFLKEAGEGLEREVASSRKKTNLFSLAGLKKVYHSTAASQPVRGAAAGAVSGAGKVATSISETLARTPKKFGPYSGRLLAAFARGGATGLGKEHFQLSQSDPDYQKLILKLKEEEANAPAK